MRRLHHLVVGPPEHGVTRYALQLAADAAGREGMTRVDALLRPGDVGPVLSRLPADASPVHVHVTDRLFGDSPEQAQGVLTALLTTGRRRVSVTLHDLPQPSDGPQSMPRRAACYAAVARAARRVVVSSEHERLLLEDCLRLAGGDGPATPLPEQVAVVPLAIDVGPVGVRPPPSAGPPDVALLGFVYPGKGHEQVLASLAGLPADVGLLALGRASDGHDDLVEQLAATARGLGRRFVVTGWLPDDVLLASLRAVAVPVAAHRHFSASASIPTWLTAGRRPLVPRSRYVGELAARLPGALTVYDDLAGALRVALDQPDTTWLDEGATFGPGTAEVAALYRAVLDAAG